MVLVACLALCSVSSFASESEYYGDSYARLSYVNGDVFVQRAEDLGYEEGVVNLAMIEGDKLGTREGRAEIHFGQRNYLRVDSNTQIDLVSLPQRGFDLIKLHLLSGNIFLRINHLEREKDFEIHTPDASFYILDEGLYNLSVKRDYESELRVYDGSAEAAGETGSVLVNSVEKIVIADGRIISDPGYFYASYDDSFYEWNISREALHNRYVARTYLPAELNEYEAELDDYGDWVYEGSYGNVWVPRVRHDTWRPYWNGRWVWYPIIGWNWVSYEPWGWCVSHYGRWQWRLGLGWYWIPTRHWGPAWVHWYYGADHYGWSPLSYYGYPGVIINNHYYARHNYHAYPAHSRTMVVVRKNQLQARHISRAALSGTQASRLGKVSLSSRQPNVKPAINRSGTIHARAARTLARTDVRKMGKSYASEGIQGSNSRISPPRIRSSSQRAVRSDSVKKGASSSRLSGSRVSSRSPSESSSASRDRSAVRGTSSRFTRSSSTIKTYPSSKQRSSSSRSRATSPRSIGADKKARVTAGSSVKQGKTYVPGKSIKYYRSQNSSRNSKSTNRSSTTQSKSSKAKTSKSKKNYTARQSSSREYAPSSRYSSSSRSQSSMSRSSSSSLSPRSSSSRSAQRSSSRYTVPSRSYSKSRTSAPKYSAPPRSSSSSRSSYSRSSKSSSKSYSKSTQSRNVRSSSSSRSSGNKSSSSSKSSSRTRKK